MSERRSALRARVELPVRVHTKDTVRWGEILLSDLSLKGFRCVTHGPFWSTGTQVTFEIPLFPTQNPLTGTARVVHTEQLRASNQYCFGLSFSDLSPSAWSQLTRYLKAAQAGHAAPPDE